MLNVDGQAEKGSPERSDGVSRDWVVGGRN